MASASISTIEGWSNSIMIEARGALAAGRPRRDAAGPSVAYGAFGLTWMTDILWPGASPVVEGADADAVVELVDATEIDRRWSGDSAQSDWCLRIDDRLLVVDRGRQADFRLTHGERLFHVSADGCCVACAVADPADPWWLRLLLDTVLWSTALLHGVEALHASAVEGPHGVIAFLGRSGGGKTTLALEFLRRGYRLFSDDVLALRRTEDGVMVYPAPPFMNVPAVDAIGPTLPIRAIATLGDEVWSSAADPCERPAMPAHLVFLDRIPGSMLELTSARSSLFELRRMCLVHGLVPGRERARFELCADLAAQTRVSHLRADPSIEPGALADLVEAAMMRPRTVA